jgi:lipoyl(octanoyl) transferase
VSTAPSTILLRELGQQSYEPVWHAMQHFTDTRTESTEDEIWFTEHAPVFKLVMNSAPDHLLSTGDIPIVQVDRGGQVTYHGPGQLMIYPLIDIRRADIGVRDLVTALEQSVVDLANDYGIEAAARADAPGVYVEGAKLASVGLRIRRGASFHGMALNVNIDIEPFTRINPCGFSNLEITDFSRLGSESDLDRVRDSLLPHFLRHLRLDDSILVKAAGELPEVTH